LSKRVLFVSTVYPYPKDDGKKIIISSILEYLNIKYGNQNVHIALIGNDEDIIDSNFKIINLKIPSKAQQAFNVLIYSFLTRKKSIQESVLFSKSLVDKLQELILKNEYDLIIFDTIRTAQYIKDKNPDEKIIVYLDDLFSIRYEKMLKTMRNLPKVNLNPLGNFGRLIPKKFVFLTNFKVISKFLLMIEKDLVRKSELKVISKFKSSLLISQDEVDYINLKYGNKNIKSIKPVLKENEYIRKNKIKNKDFIFLGNLSIPHNDISIINFINKNIEKMLKHDLRLRIIGKNPSEDVKNLEKKYSNNIKIIGYVENLEQEFQNARGMVVPLLFGSGVKLKTLEAFSYGLPVIATNYGIEGINVGKNKSICLLENDLDNYWEKMLYLCDEKINEKFSKEGYDFFRSQYSKETVYNSYEKLLVNNN
jgi:polysaccharide biosynthesis protein PslH